MGGVGKKIAKKIDEFLNISERDAFASNTQGSNKHFPLTVMSTGAQNKHRKKAHQNLKKIWKPDDDDLMSVARSDIRHWQQIQKLTEPTQLPQNHIPAPINANEGHKDLQPEVVNVADPEYPDSNQESHGQTK